jgi:cell division protein FtsL
MIKNVLIFVAVIAGLSLLAVSFLMAKYTDQQEIMRAQTEMQTLKEERAALTSQVAGITAQQKLLETQVADLKTQVTAKEKLVADLEQKRKDQQLSVRKLSRPKEVEELFAKTFPEVAKSKWGVTKIHDEENDVELTCLTVPLFFAKTFVNDHENSLNFEKQRDKLVEVSTLKDQIIGLQEKNLSLEKEKSAAFEAGYNKAFGLYTDLNGKYVELLKHPTVEFKPPGLVSTLSGALIGLAIGTKL